MLNFPYRKHLWRAVIPLLVLLAAAAAAVLLYWESPGIPGVPSVRGVHGVAEVREYTVSSVETGRLASVEVVVGQRVSRSQVVAGLDTDMVHQQIRIAEAELRELEAQVAAEAKFLDLSVLERKRLFQSDLERAEIELGEVRSGCASDRAELAAVEEELSRQRDLVQRSLTSSGRMHELQVRITALQEVVASCPSRMEGLESRKLAAQQRYDVWRLTSENSLGGRGSHEQLHPLELRSARQREHLDLLRIRLENMSLRAPIDGEVVSVLALTGNVLTPGDPLMVIVEANPRQVIAYIEEDRDLRIAAGDRAVMRPRDRAGVPVEGAVVAIAETVSQMPPRFWTLPTRPRWGRQVFIRIDPAHDASPGEAFDITFKSRKEALALASTDRASAALEKVTNEGISPLVVPANLLERSRFEPSGIIWVESMQQYLSVSDDTGLEEVAENSPWVFPIDRSGGVGQQPLPIEGVPRVNDLEGIAASPDGKVYLIASQSENRKGIRRSLRTIFICARLEANRLRSENHVSFHDLLAEAGQSDPRFLASLGLEAGRHREGPTVEIEGLAWHRGALFLGLKKPLDSAGRALIWRIGKPDHLFTRRSLSGAELALWKRVLLRVEGIPAGISELLLLDNGSLILAGTNDRGGALFRATETVEDELRASIFRMYPGLKPEGLCLSPDRRLVVVFDQQQNSPLWAKLELPQ